MVDRRAVRRLLFAATALVAACTLLAGVTGVGVDAAARTRTLDDLRLDGPGYLAAVAELDAAHGDIDWARQEIRRQRDLIEQLESGLVQIDAGLPSLAARIDATGELADQARDDLASLAVLHYVVRGTDRDLMAITTSDGDGGDNTAQRVLVMDTAMAGHRATLDLAERRQADAVSAVETAEVGLVELRSRLQTARSDLSFAETVLAESSSRLPHIETRIANERRRTRVVGSDISFVALEAYVLAARDANSRLGCGLDWTLLAGIGRVESRHGTYGGTSLDDDGTVANPIIGIQLNGDRRTAVVADTDDGRLDGDTVFDRAVGPMQFIPSTWARFGVDANGDGVADPQNVYDSASAAADYLCRAGDLRDDTTLRHAIRTYNNSEVYVIAVLKSADTYADLDIAA